MKSQIHPTYFQHATVACVCGAVYEVGSTKERNPVELCAACHPFFTGTQTFVDTARRVEKFRERVSGREKAAVGKIGRAIKRVRRVEKRKIAGPTVEVVETKTGRIVKKALRVKRGASAETAPEK